MKLEESLYHLIYKTVNNQKIVNNSDIYQNVAERCMKEWLKGRKIKGMATRYTEADLYKIKRNILKMFEDILSELNKLDIDAAYANISGKSKSEVENIYDISISSSKLCELLQISRPTISTLIKNGLKSSKNGKLYSFKVKDVLIYIKNNHKYSMYYEKISKDFNVKV